jgi:hypothetical protein
MEINIKYQQSQKQTKEIKTAMKKSETNLEVLKASLESLKNRYMNQVNTENKFASQNKEYVIGLLKKIA